MDFEHIILSLTIITFWGFIALLFLFAAYITGLPIIIVEKIKDNYKRIKSLKSLVSTQYSGLFSILFYTIKMIFKTSWVSFIQYMNNNVAQQGKYYRVSYVIRGRLYKILVSPAKGPPNIIGIVNEKYDDVTDEIFPYIRAQETIVKDITPEILGCNILEISTSDADVYTFNQKECVKLKKE